MRRILSSRKGFTLMELLVLVAILGVLMAVVGAAVTGIKSSSVDGQVQSDAKAAQTATDNYNNKSIKTGQFPDTTPDAASHINQDVADVGNPSNSSGDGATVILVRADGLGQTLFDKTIPFGTSSAVFQRRLVVFTSTTDTWDDSTGAVKTSTFVPDYLLKEPTSLILKGDESKDLGATNNVFEEYLWLNLVNAPGTDSESRTVEVYRMSAADCSGTINTNTNTKLTDRNQPAVADAPDPADISAADITTLKGEATGCSGNTDTVNGLVYEQVY